MHETAIDEINHHINIKISQANTFTLHFILCSTQPVPVILMPFPFCPVSSICQQFCWIFYRSCHIPFVCVCVCLSPCPSHLFHYVPIIISSWNFWQLLPWTKVMSMQKVKVKGQGHRGQSKFGPNLGFLDHNSSFNSQMATKWCT